MKHATKILLACLMLIPATATAGETVTYHDGDVELEGYWAQPVCTGISAQAPVVLIIHQWKGLGDYEKRRADMLAKECYNAFAIDMYGKGVRPKNNEEAGVQAGLYKGDPALARRRIKAALDFAKTRPTTAPSHVAAIGYCFGGTMALELARSGANINGVVSFHGGLSSKAPVTQPGAIKASIQVHHGADDPLVPPEEVNGFIGEMDKAEADWVLTKYAGAVHSFTEKEAGDDPSGGVAYNEKADKRSWAATLDFLRETLNR